MRPAALSALGRVRLVAQPTPNAARSSTAGQTRRPSIGPLADPARCSSYSAAASANDDAHHAPCTLAIVTGASRGLGAAVCRQLLSSSFGHGCREAHLVMVASDSARLNRAAEELRQALPARRPEGPAAQHAAGHPQHAATASRSSSPPPVPSSSGPEGVRAAAAGTVAAQRDAAAEHGRPRWQVLTAAMDLGDLDELEGGVRALLSGRHQGGLLPLPPEQYTQVHSAWRH